MARCYAVAVATRSAWRRAAAAAAAFAALPGALAVAARPAHANGRFPAVSSLAPDAADPPFLLVGATFGLVLTTDGEATWGWVCEQAMGYLGTFDPIFVRTHVGAGALLASTFDGVSRSADGGCNWDAAAGLAGHLVRGLAEHPGAPGTIYATTGYAAPPDVDALFVSTDDGATFSATALQSGAMYYDGVAASALDPLRLYVGSWYPMPREAFVHRSDDGGASWTSTAYPVADPQILRLVAVAPDDPDVVLWVIEGTGDILFRSDDGGLTGAPVLALPAPFAGLTVAGDGTMYAAAALSQMFQSLDDGLTWEPLGPAAPPSLCVAAGAGRLFACSDPFSAGGASIMSSTDDGVTWTADYALSDTTGPLACPAGADATLICGPLWPQVAVELGAGGGAGTDAGSGGPGDSGVIVVGRDGGPGGGGGGACHCSLLGARGDAGRDRFGAAWPAAASPALLLAFARYAARNAAARRRRRERAGGPPRT
jgi:hypothetical protein